MLATVFFLTITITARRVLPRDEKHVLSLRLELEMKLSDFLLEDRLTLLIYYLCYNTNSRDTRLGSQKLLPAEMSTEIYSRLLASSGLWLHGETTLEDPVWDLTGKSQVWWSSSFFRFSGTKNMECPRHMFGTEFEESRGVPMASHCARERDARGHPWGLQAISCFFILWSCQDHLVAQSDRT